MYCTVPVYELWIDVIFSFTMAQLGIADEMRVKHEKNTRTKNMGQAWRTATRKLVNYEKPCDQTPRNTITQTPRCVQEICFLLLSFLSQQKTTHVETEACKVIK